MDFQPCRLLLVKNLSKYSVCGSVGVHGNRRVFQGLSAYSRLGFYGYGGLGSACPPEPRHRRTLLFASVLVIITILFSVSAESALTLRDRGDVVWYGYDGNDYEIFLYSNGIVIQLTDNDYDDYLVT